MRLSQTRAIKKRADDILLIRVMSLMSCICKLPFKFTMHNINYQLVFFFLLY